MKIEEKVLSEITDLAKMQFSINEVAIILQLDTDAFMESVNTKTGDIYLAYQRGVLISSAEVRKSIYDLAKQGSSPAQKQFSELEKQREKLNKKGNDAI